MFTKTNEQHLKQFKYVLVNVTVCYMFYKMGMRVIPERFELLLCEYCRSLFEPFSDICKELNAKAF